MKLVNKMPSNPAWNQSSVSGRILLAVVAGLWVAYLRLWLAFELHNGAADFFFSLRIIRDLWHGRDPYAYPIEPDLVAYPLPAGFLAAAFAPFPDELASGIFMGLSGGLFVWYLLKRQTFWPLVILLSWPFVYALIYAQYSPLIACIWFAPAFAPLVLVKPQIALPLILTNRINWRAMGAGIIVLIATLLIYPTWPFVWLGKITTYRGAPPLLSIPLGPILLLALLKYRDRRAWLFLLLALMPQRVIYDQLSLLLIAASGTQAVFLVLCSWSSLPVLISSGGWMRMPINWQFWIVLTLYIPALIVLFWDDINLAVREFLAKTSRNVG